MTTEYTSTPLSLPDLLVYAAESETRPQDFTLVLRLKEPPPHDDLQAGARSARCRFPRSDARLHRFHWQARMPGPTSIALGQHGQDLPDFVAASLDLRRGPPLAQLLVKPDAGPTILATRLHHAAGDGASLAAWLSHQWGVATGRIQPLHTPRPFDPPHLRSHPHPVRRSPFAFAGPCDRLWQRTSGPTRNRSWRTLVLPAGRLRRLCGQMGVAYTDLLAAILLDVLRRWNHSQGRGAGERLGLWLPVNIRRRGSAGFGNGTSRIRLYANYPGSPSLAARCRALGRQRLWSLRRGEWAIPRRHPLLGLPRWMLLPALRSFLRRPGIDMASSVLSHVEDFGNFDPHLAHHVAGIEVVGQLHPFYPVVFNGVTLEESTWLTLTHDTALLDETDVGALAEMVEEGVEAALAPRSQP